MIRINLLGDEVSYDTNSVLWLIAFFASVLLTVSVGAGAWYYLSGENESLREETVLLERQLTRLKDQTKGVKDLDARKNELQAMTMVIAVLKQIQEGPVRLMDDVNTAVPDRLWFQNFELKDLSLKIEGIALVDAALVEFMRGLEKSPFFERVDLRERNTVPLAQINAFSTFDGSQARKVVRGERDKVQAALADLRQEIESQGLVYVLGAPDALVPQVKQPLGTAAQDPSAQSDYEGLRRLSGRPSVYVWESLEQVRGENFTIEAKVRLTEKPIPMDAILAQLSAVPKDPASQGAAPKGAAAKGGPSQAKKQQGAEE